MSDNIINIVDKLKKKTTRELKDSNLLPTNSFSRTGYGPCKHLAVSVDKEARVVECRKCGKDLDPYGVLYMYANGERDLLLASNDIRVYRKEIIELKTELKNLKSRIAAARRTVKSIENT